MIRTKPKIGPGRPATGRLRRPVSVTLGPEAIAILEQLRTTPRGKLTISTVVGTLLLRTAQETER